MDRSIFEDPFKTDFYLKNRDFKGEESPFKLVTPLSFHKSSVNGIILNEKDNVKLKFEIKFYIHGIFRFSLLEEKACYTRPEVPGVLIDKLQEQAITVDQFNEYCIITYGDFNLRITYKTFLFEVIYNDIVVMEINRHNLFNFEHLPVEPMKESRGTRSLGLDFSFLQTKAVYGLPERATSFRLQMTKFVY